MKEQSISVDGVEIRFTDTERDSQAIVFVHGNSGSRFDFRPQFEGRLADEFRLIGIDLPGHGASGKAKLEEYGIPFYSRCLVSFLQVVNAKNAVPVGWSLGGHIVLESVDALVHAPGFVIFGTPPLTYPANIDAAFLPNPSFAAGMTGVLEEDEARQYADSFLGNSRNDALLDYFTESILATDPDAREGLRMSTEHPIVNEVQLLARMKKPLAILHGLDEKLVSQSYIEALRAPTLWRGQIQVVPGAGHSIQLEAAGRFDTLIEDFVKEVCA